MPVGTGFRGSIPCVAIFLLARNFRKRRLGKMTKLKNRQVERFFRNRGNNKLLVTKNWLVDKGGQSSFMLDWRLSPKQINEFRIKQAEIFTAKEYSKSSSRMLLNNYDKTDIVCVSGIVSDIVVDKDFVLKEDGSNFKQNKTRLLIDNPYIEWVITKYGKQRVRRKLDSHIWFYVDEILHMNPKKDKLTVSIGDMMMMAGRVKEYYGRGDYGVKAIKYGLGDLVLIDSGMQVRSRVDKEKYTIVSNYPRKDDWVLKCERNLNSEAKGRIGAIRYRESLYPSYKERMTINKLEVGRKFEK